MSSLSMYTLVNRIDDDNSLNNRRETVTRFQMPSSIGKHASSIRPPLADVHSADDLKSDVEYSVISNDYEPSINRENILFIYLDLHSQLTSSSIASLRAINNDVQGYTDPSTCADLLRSSSDKIFFISSSADKQLIEEFHNINSIEAIFILNSEAQIDNRFPKVYGVYVHFEELLLALKNTLEWYEQTQMDLFVFERDRIFLWSQLWKEEVIKLQKSNGSSNKAKLLSMGEHYYRGNIKLNQWINEFDQSYNKNDALQWCFSSPFPSRFLLRALRFHNVEHLHACRFLLTDVSHIIQRQSNKKSSCELYKGMKMTNEFLDKLENYTGKLICPKGFLICSQSRKGALEVASSLDHRPDLMPVLFKITYDRSVPLVELSNKDVGSLMIFDVYTVFRVKYVNRGQVSIVKIEPANEDGRKLALEYRNKYESESIQNLLDELLSPPKPPVRLPPLQRSSLPLAVLSDLSPNDVDLSIISEEDDEIQAQELIERGEIDEAIAFYLRLRPDSARVLNIIGLLYAEKKGDYESSIKYYNMALEIHEKSGEDCAKTLSQLGIVHQNRHEYDLALSCHSRALNERKKAANIDPVAVASSLIGIANAYWGQQNLTEALNHAQEALTLNESVQSGNELNIATNLATLANIHHNAGDFEKALEVAKRALTILEPAVPPDSVILATLLNNVGIIQVASGSLTDAGDNFDKALVICKKSLPEGHPKRVAMEKNIHRIAEMKKRNEQSSNL